MRWNWPNKPRYKGKEGAEQERVCDVLISRSWTILGAADLPLITRCGGNGPAASLRVQGHYPLYNSRSCSKWY